MAAATSFAAAASSSTTRPPIPLTTIFTPPATCLDVVTYDGTSFWQNGISQTGDLSCYPSGFAEIYNSYYTPGICPQSWTSVGEVDHSSGFDAMCCPSSYFLFTTDQGILQNVCASLINTDLTNVWSTSTLASGPLPQPHPLTTVAKPKTSNTVWADVIQVQWQSSNSKIISLLAAQTSSAAKASASRSSTTAATKTTAAASVTSTTAPVFTSSSSSSGLSTGAKAGIGVGVALGVIALAALAFFLFRWKNNKRRYAATPTEDVKEGGFHEMPNDHEMQTAPVELDARDVNELPGSEARIEMDHKEPAERRSSHLSTTKTTPRHSQGFLS